MTLSRVPDLGCGTRDYSESHGAFVATATRIIRWLREVDASLAHANVGLDAERCGKRDIGAACFAVHATVGTHVLNCALDVQSISSQVRAASAVRGARRGWWFWSAKMACRSCGRTEKCGRS